MYFIEQINFLVANDVNSVLFKYIYTYIFYINITFILNWILYIYFIMFDNFYI